MSYYDKSLYETKVNLPKINLNTFQSILITHYLVICYTIRRPIAEYLFNKVLI